MSPDQKSSETASPQAAPNSWMAACTSTNHPTGATWQGAKRSNRREAIRDATNHNNEFGHHAEVIALPH